MLFTLHPFWLFYKSVGDLSSYEFYSSVLLASVGLSGDLFTPTFAVSRIAGWTAHILEQASNNRLIRPEAEYTGPMDMNFIPLSER